MKKSNPYNIPTIIFLSLFIGALSTGIAQETIKERLDHCATVTNAIERLVCYDNLHSAVQTEVPAPVDTDTLTTTGLEGFGFEFISYSFEKTSLGSTEIVAEIKNNTDIPQTVKIEVITRDADGTLIDTQEFVVTSFINIEPEQTRGIKQTITRKEDAASFDIKILSLHKW